MTTVTADVRTIPPQRVDPDELHREPVYKHTTQCSATVKESYISSGSAVSRRDRYTCRVPGLPPPLPDIDRCQRMATISVDGRPYCKSHAALVVLHLHMREEDDNHD